MSKADTSDPSSDSDNSTTNDKGRLCSVAKQFAEGTSTKPTLYDALKQFNKSKPRHHMWIDFFKRMIEKYGSYCKCDREYDDKQDYDRYHSVEVVLSEVNSFLTNFVVEKCAVNASENKAAAAAMSALIKFCAEKGWITKDEAKEPLKMITNLNKFDGNALEDGFQELHKNKYWHKFVKGGFKEEKCDKWIETEHVIEIMEVRKDGWIMDTDSPSMESGCDSSEDSDDSDGDGKVNGAFVRLPAALAKKGVVGAGFSCMGLKRCKGIWIPHGVYDERSVCGNVCPP